MTLANGHHPPTLGESRRTLAMDRQEDEPLCVMAGVEMVRSNMHSRMLRVRGPKSERRSARAIHGGHGQFGLDETFLRQRQRRSFARGIQRLGFS
jgi:hypothetical protein